MPSPISVALVSDIHYPGPSERLRGNDCEYRDLPNPFQRAFSHHYRNRVWLRRPLDQAPLLDRFLERLEPCDHLFALGDYNCDTACVGVSDDAAFESAAICLGRLRERHRGPLHALIGDHDLGKFPFFGERGGLRLASWRRAVNDLQLQPLWRVDLGCRVALGFTSTLLSLPIHLTEVLPEERDAWHALRTRHLQELREVLRGIEPSRRLVLFTHDPTALPFLWEEPMLRERAAQIECTFVGHLHSPLILRKSRWLAGMPSVSWMGHTVKRLTTALGQARQWRPFKVRLCPSLAGMELFKDGGHLTLELHDDDRPLEPVFHPLPR